MVIIELFVLIIRLFTMVVVAPGHNGRGLTLGYHGFGLYFSVSDDVLLTGLAIRPVVNTLF